MTRVDFAFNAGSRVAQAAHSTLRHVARGARLFVYCDEPERLKAFDQALWTVQDTAFVPHEMLHDDSTDLPVFLVDQASWPLVAAHATEEDWLVNLDDDCPPEATLFTRVLEIVSRDDHDREQARTRWRQYQAIGAELRAHQLTNKG